MPKRVGYIGLGTMGGAMARNLVQAGFEVQGYDPAPEMRERARGAGVKTVESAAEAARGVEVVCSSVPETEDVRDVYLGERGVIGATAGGLVCFDFSTISPEGSCQVAEEAKRAGVTFLDTPVAGSAPAAQAAQLIVLVGGDQAGLDRHRDVLDAVSEAVHFIGPNGYGLRMKLVSNHLVSGILALLAEALTLGKKSGLDPEQTIDFVIGSFAPKIFAVKGPAMVKKDYTPTFRVDLMRKDLRLIAELAESAKVPIPISSFVRQVFMGATCLGFGDQDQNAILEWFERGAGL